MSGIMVSWTADEALAKKCLPRDKREHPDYNLSISQEPGKDWGSNQTIVFVTKGLHKDPNHQVKPSPHIQSWLEQVRHRPVK